MLRGILNVDNRSQSGINDIMTTGDLIMLCDKALMLFINCARNIFLESLTGSD